jgi:hypothetical protein
LSFEYCICPARNARTLWKANSSRLLDGFGQNLSPKMVSVGIAKYWRYVRGNRVHSFVRSESPTPATRWPWLSIVVVSRSRLRPRFLNSVESAGSAMRPSISLFSRCVLLSAALCSAPIHRLGVVSHDVLPSGESPSARFITEVRLRRLHLARPDLIPYPIETEIYC